MKVRSLIILFLAIAAFYSCNKDIDLVADDVATTKLNVINVTSDTLNYYLNGTRQNSTSSIYAGGATGYLAVKSGAQNYQFKKYGQADVLFSKSLTLATVPDTSVTSTITNGTVTTTISTRARGYTFYVTGETVDKSFLLKDTIKINPDSATIRFVHTSDGVAALDVYVGTAVSFKNQAYGSISTFKTAVTGSKVITVYLAGGTVAKATQKLTLSSGTAYTLYVKGQPDGTGKSALTVGSFINY